MPYAVTVDANLLTDQTKVWPPLLLISAILTTMTLPFRVRLPPELNKEIVECFTRQFCLKAFSSLNSQFYVFIRETKSAKNCKAKDEDQREENAQYVLNGTSYKALIPRLPEHRNALNFFFQWIIGARESVRQYFAREGTTDTFEQYFECRLNFVQLPHDPTYDWDVLQITYTVDSILSNWSKLMSFIFDDVISRIENGQVPDRPGSPPSLL